MTGTLETSAPDAPPHAEPRRGPLSRWWLNLPIRYKGLLVVALPLIIVAATVMMRLPFNRQQQATTALLTRAADTRDASQELLIALLDVESGLHGYVVTGDRQFLERFERSREMVPERLDHLSSLLARPQDQQIYQDLADLVDQELDMAADLLSRKEGLTTTGDDFAAAEPLVQEPPIMHEIRIALVTLGRNQQTLIDDSQAELERLRNRLSPIVLITFFGGLGAAMTAGWLFATGVASRVTALERNAERLAIGERLHSEPSRGLDEIGSLDRALRRASVLLRSRHRELQSTHAELERRVYEQALLNRELEAFSYSVSHDLRAPLRSIDGFAQALREDWGERLDETAQDQLSRVRNAAQKMGRLIDDLLKLSRLTRAQVQRAEVDLSQIARDVCEELRERNPSRDVQWVIAQDLRASCDPALARILLENLLGNAWKFTSKTMAASIELDALPQTSPAIFVVRDNGAGFDMRYVEKLFAPFQRLHAEREFPGTGIGLATVQRIVFKHGGEVATRGVVGHGARFFFTLESSDTPMQLPESA